MARQEKAINSMTADDFVLAVDTFKALKRNPEAIKKQRNFTKNFKKEVQQNILRSMEKQRENIPCNDKCWMSNEQIEINAKERTDSIVDGMAALHDPDQVVGGYFMDNIKHIGGSDVNSYLGPSMKGGRVEQMRDAAIRQQNLGKGSSNMNISLTLKPLNPKK